MSMIYRLIIIVGIGFVGGCSTQPKTPQEHLQYAEKQFKAGNTDEAIRSYRIVLLQDSLSYAARIGLVKAYQAKGNNEAASLLRRKVVESTYIDGLNAFNQGDWSRARTLFETTLLTQPNFSLALNRLADIHAAQGDTSAAIAAYQRSVSADSMHAGAHATLGTLLLATNRLPQAKAAFERAIALDMNHIQAYIGLGAIFSAQNKWQQAADQYRTALLIDPQSPAGKQGLSQARQHL